MAAPWLRETAVPRSRMKPDVKLTGDQTGRQTPEHLAMTYIFDHTFKTAGTTFNLSYLPAAFQPEERCIVPGFLEPNRLELERLAALPAEERGRFKVIAGHNAGRLRPVCPEARWLTLVRSPAERVISGYLHARFHGDAWEAVGREIHENNISLAQFVELDLFARRYAEFVSMHDWQARTLLGPEWAPSLLKDRVAIAERIRSRFHLVGYCEAFERFLFFLHLTEGFPLVLFNNRLVSQERRAFYATAEDVLAIERYIQADRVVYECARQEFDRRVAEIWNEERNRAYDRYLEALEEFRHANRENMDATSLYSSGSPGPWPLRSSRGRIRPMNR